ncbi:sigma 54-interacting transcriptional regulator [Brevibacillus sp. H7]|uniref:sigma 54-interacting transcriptional regulator n=1 Tax=Brevibacillus sp. H7 TaxID=3349138 RepID=UPI00381B0BAC
MQVKDMVSPVPFHLRPSDTIATAVRYMLETKFTVLPVQDSELVGVFTNSILYRLILAGVSLDEPLEPYLKQDLITIPSDTPYEEIEELVRNSDVGTGIVVDPDKRVVGLLTKTDIVMFLLRSSTLLREQLETLLQSITAGTLMLDQERRILYANSAFARITGTDAGILASKSLNEMLPELDAEIPSPHDGDPFVSKRVLLNGTPLLAQICAFSMLGGETGIIVVFQELTELEAIAEELESVKKWRNRLHTVLEHAYDGVVLVDEQGMIQFVSQGLSEFFRIDQQQLIHQPISRVLPQLDVSGTLESGLSDMSPPMEMNGIPYILKRIPIRAGDQVIGAVGQVMFRQLKELAEMAKRIHLLESQVAYYREELKKQIPVKYGLGSITTNDPAMLRLKRTASQAAKGRSTILIRGESGTGKELFAHAIHAESGRRNGPFISVNCAAIPEHLLESEFFGYAPGAFTGAERSGKPGKFDLANGGTLFLDEIGDMSPGLQAKLLRVLEEREFYRVGGTERIQVDVRILAATHQSLEDLVARGVFREDLFYRLNVISLDIPPLRERGGDILLLARQFVQELQLEHGTAVRELDPQVEQALLTYHWPGNVRELRNCIERALTFAEDGWIRLSDLPSSLRSGSHARIEHKRAGNDSGATWKHKREQEEREMIIRILETCADNKSHAAKQLGMSRSTLYEKLKKYNLS